METTNTVPVPITIEHRLAPGEVWGLLFVSSALLAALVTFIVYNHGTLHDIFFGRD